MSVWVVLVYGNFGNEVFPINAVTWEPSYQVRILDFFDFITAKTNRVMYQGFKYDMVCHVLNVTPNT